MTEKLSDTRTRPDPGADLGRDREGGLVIAPAEPGPADGEITNTEAFDEEGAGIAPKE